MAESRVIERPLVLHPFIIAVYPVLALLTRNLDWSPPTDAIRVLILSLTASVVIFALIYWVVQDIWRAGLITSLILLLFFSYGHIYGIMKSAGLGASIGRHRYLAPAFAVAFVVVLLWTLRSRPDARTATRILNLSSAALLLIPLASIAAYLGQIRAAPTVAQSASNLRIPEGRSPPDVYYIVLDAYARHDTLEQVYELDNGPFLQFLEEQGFFVAYNSRSNYAQTSLSLAAALNMDYIHALFPESDPGRESLWDVIQHSEVRSQFESLGYEIVAFSSGLSGTEWRDADVYLSPPTGFGLGQFNPLESMLASTTMLRLVSDGAVALPSLVPALEYPYELHRARIRHTLDGMANLPSQERPRFVFAHLISPHPPFVFDASGEPITPDAPFALRYVSDPNDPSREQYLRGYRDQLTFLNRELEQVIDAILANSDTTPVIVLQADHGPDSKSGRVSYVQERMKILNAILLPDGSDGLTPGLTPVNTFRVILDQVFGGDYGRVPGRALYSEYERPFEFIDVTGSILPP